MNVDERPETPSLKHLAAAPQLFGSNTARLGRGEGPIESCAAWRPEFPTATQGRSRVNLDQTAGPGFGDNLAPNSTSKGQTRWQRPAGDTFAFANRPEAEA